jgi:hypothetical protein
MAPAGRAHLALPTCLIRNVPLFPYAQRLGDSAHAGHEVHESGVPRTSH